VCIIACGAESVTPRDARVGRCEATWSSQRTDSEAITWRQTRRRLPRCRVCEGRPVEFAETSELQERTSALARAASTSRVPPRPRPPHTMATILRRGARPSVLFKYIQHGTRSVSSRFGFGAPFPQDQQQRQPTQAFSPIPYVTESSVRSI
jgi:hypothetical protein